MSDTSTPAVFATTNPATLEPGKSYPGHSTEDAARKIAQGGRRAAQLAPDRLRRARARA